MIILSIGFIIWALSLLNFAITELFASVFPRLYFEIDEKLSIDEMEFVRWSSEK